MKTTINVDFTKNNTNKKNEVELGFFVRGVRLQTNKSLS